MTNSNTPRTISKQVNRLISKLNLKAPPVYVKVQPESGAIVSQCFPNVERKVLSSGGKMLCGGQIWEWPNVMIEAEFHAIWQSPEGDWVDITPKQDEEQTILFAHTPKRPYDGKRVDNVRLALRDDTIIHHFIQISELISKALQDGREFEYGFITVPEAKMKPLMEAKRFLLGALKAGYRDHDTCCCKSSIKYKRCCGKEIQKYISESVR